MYNRICSYVLIILTSLCLTIPAVAKTDWRVNQTVQLEQPPIDLQVSSSKKWIYVLTSDSKILIYDARGQLKDTITVEPDIDQIKAGSRDDMLFLLSRKNKTFQAITIDFVEEINTQGSPVKGPTDAPVTIAVFSDFQ